MLPLLFALNSPSPLTAPSLPSLLPPLPSLPSALPLTRAVRYSKVKGVTGMNIVCAVFQVPPYAHAYAHMVLCSQYAVCGTELAYGAMQLVS
eukprot:230601-Rhodomonas_salina.1